MATIKRIVKITLTKRYGLNGLVYEIKVYHDGIFQDIKTHGNYSEAMTIYLNAVKNATTICTVVPLESYEAEV